MNYCVPNLNINKADHQLLAIQRSDRVGRHLQQACRDLCKEFSELFKPELGCLLGVQLEVAFKPEARPIFCKPRSVPFAMQEDLAQAYDAGIARDIWTSTSFNDWGTPVVPVRKTPQSSNEPASRVCGDYSVTINPQLETHRHPLPLPEELMQRLGGGYGFTKIDLVDAYSQVRLGPKSRESLALSTHRRVLLQNVLPFGISSAPDNFQQVMDESSCDLPGVAVYLDDILCSSASAEAHLRNRRRLLERLLVKGLRCQLDQSTFAQSQVVYLSHVLSSEGIHRGSKVNALNEMPAPHCVSTLRTFVSRLRAILRQVLPPNFACGAEMLYHLTRKANRWACKSEEEAPFRRLKELLSTADVLVHFDPSLPLGVACDASAVQIDATLFHRYHDGSERPIVNISKTLTASQRNYSQIQKESLAIIHALKNSSSIYMEEISFW